MPTAGPIRIAAALCATVTLGVATFLVLFGDPPQRPPAGHGSAARVMVSIPVEIIEDGEAPALRRIEVAR